jgi:hypothetical protein
MLVGAPFYASIFRIELPFEIGGAVILVALAALTNPHSKRVMYLNAICSGVGLVVYETWALFDYDTSTWLVFLLRELIALMFCGAFYFSMKTLRAMLLNKIGKEEEPGEFGEKYSAAALMSRDEAHEEEENIYHFEEKERNILEEKIVPDEEEHHKMD